MRYHRPKVNKHVSLAFSVLVALNGGVSYAYGLWAPLLKQHGLDQRAVAKLGAAHAGFGAYSSFFAGLLYDRLERRQHVGPRLTLLVGCLVSSIGFRVLYQAISSEHPVSFPLLVGLAIVAGNGCTWFDVSPMSTNVRNFPTERGWVIGIIKSSIGLSGGLYSIVFFQGLFHGDASAFLRFLSWGPSLIVALCVPFVNYVPYVQESERCDRMNTRRFQSAVGVIGFLALYVMGVSLVSGLREVSGHLQGMFALGAVVCLLPLFGITFDSGGLFARERQGSVREMEIGVDEVDEVEEPLVLGGGGREEEEEGEGERTNTNTNTNEDGEAYVDRDEENDDEMEGETREQRRLLHVYPSHTLRECLCSSGTFYVLGLSTGIGIASGLTFLNNSPQLVGSLGGSGQEQTVVVAFFSCSSCLGRLIFGAVSETVMQRFAISRVWFLIVAALGSTVVYSMLSLQYVASSPMILYPLSLLSGLFFGGHWAMLPSLASELHGLTSFASIYSVLQFFPGVIAYVLGSYVGARYDAVGRAHGDALNECVGPDCFLGSFETIALLSAGGLALSVGLYVKTREQYRHLVGELLELEAEVGLRKGIRMMFNFVDSA